jgi:hypothetical protein
MTPYSLGVMADVRGGGLKQDLSSLFEANRLPAEFNNRRLYQTTHGITGVSDPNWNALAAYYNSFRNLTAPDTSPSFIPSPGANYIEAVPSTYNPAPVIAKVDTIFSMVGRPLTDVFKVQRPYFYTEDLSRATATLMKRDVTPSFAVTAQIQTTANDPLVSFAKLQFDYNDDSTLGRVFNDRVYRYPPTGSLTGSEVAAPGGVFYNAQGPHVHSIAIFSAYCRTTNGGVFETGLRTKSPIDSPQVNLLRDGRLAGKPYLFHNPSRANFTANLTTEKPAGQAYELNFQPFLSKGDYQDYMDVDASNRVPSLSGNKTTTGIKSGSYLELPSGPLQTIADFRRSNALTTSFPPYFVQPVGNSLLHPLMSADKVIETNPSLSISALLDHSVLANHAL